MTDSTSTLPSGQIYQPLSSPEARAHRRVVRDTQFQIVAAARERVPNISVPSELPAVAARKHLKEARRQFGSQANRFLNRATRRSLAREVGLA